MPKKMPENTVLEHALNDLVESVSLEIIETATKVAATDIDVLGVLETVTCNVLIRLQLDDGREAKIMKMMRDRVIKRLAGNRMLAGAQPSGRKPS